MRPVTFATALSFAVLPHAAQAADTYAFDPQHTWVGFAINHAGWAKAIGKFGKATGQIVINRDDLAKSSVTVEIVTASIDTGFDKRDRDLQGPDFLNVAEFPTMTFASTAVELTGDKTAKVTGDLTLIGVTRPVTLEVAFNGEKPLPWDTKVLKSGFSATGSFAPAEFGMAKVRAFGLGPDVELMLEVEAVKQ
jgi:polyisoprenoid-binding protein YceI